MYQPIIVYCTFCWGHPSTDMYMLECDLLQHRRGYELSGALNVFLFQELLEFFLTHDLRANPLDEWGPINCWRGRTFGVLRAEYSKWRLCSLSVVLQFKKNVLVYMNVSVTLHCIPLTLVMWTCSDMNRGHLHCKTTELHGVISCGAWSVFQSSAQDIVTTLYKPH